MKKLRIRERPVYYFIPAALVLGILAVYPLLRNFWLGFTDKQGDFTLGNYIRLFSNKWFWNSMLISGKWLVVTVAGELLIGLTLAILLNQKLRGTRFFRSIFMIPWITPMIAVCTIWAWMYNGDFGILSYAINKLFRSDISFLSNPKTALYWLALVYIWKRSSFSMLMYLSGLQGIPEEIYEACKLDGVPWYRQLTNVTLPLMFPVIRSLLLMSIITSLNQFTIGYSITGGGPARSTELIQMYIYNIGIAGYQYNYGASASTAFLVIVLFLAIIYINVTEKTEEEIY